MRRRSGPVASALFLLATAVSAGEGGLLFHDDFEAGLSKWVVSDPAHVEIVDAPGGRMGHALRLTPEGSLVPAVLRRLRSLPPAEPVFALVEGSEAWGSYRLDGRFYLPEEDDSYLGVIYHYREIAGRVDFGSIYAIAKPGSHYVRVNPHFDWNPGRALYEELRVDLPGPAPLGPRRWVPFALEVVGSSAHFYVADDFEPRVTFSSFAATRGAAGLNPRSIGGSVLVDDIRVRAIEAHRYRGAPRPRATVAAGEKLLTDWYAAGPFLEPEVRIESGQAQGEWVPFPSDERGAVVSGRLLGHASGWRVGYFRTALRAELASRVEFSTSVPIRVWLDGRAAQLDGPGVGVLDFRRVAWFDFREGPQAWLDVPPGEHELLVRVETDYAGVGFFARIVRASPRR